MSALDIIKLKFISPLHLSRGKAGLENSFETLHSDTLKSALFVCALQLYKDAEILRGDNGMAFFNAFRVSSAFPYASDELFFPKPEWINDTLKTEVEPKDFKEIKFIGWAFYKGLISGSADKFLPQNIRNKKYYTDKVMNAAPFESEVVQRVVVPRDYEHDADTFYTERLYFKNDCGMFFLISFEDETWREIVMSALALLGENGIGSDKSVGNGQFEVKPKTPFAFDTFEADKKVSLSLYCPKQGEVNKKEFIDASAYSIIKRGGYLANPEDFDNSTLRKKSVYMFTEGSVFPNENLIGQVVDLKPDEYPNIHNVWRDGRALFLPYKMTIGL
jgi:CRISPR-associated protein Csm4